MKSVESLLLELAWTGLAATVVIGVLLFSRSWAWLRWFPLFALLLTPTPSHAQNAEAKARAALARARVAVTEQQAIKEALDRIEDRLATLEYHLTPKTRTPADGERLWKHDWWWRFDAAQGRYEPEGEGWKLADGYWVHNAQQTTYQSTSSYQSASYQAPTYQPAYRAAPVLRGGFLGRSAGGSCST